MDVKQFCSENNITTNQYYGKSKIIGDFNCVSRVMPKKANLRVSGQVVLKELSNIPDGTSISSGRAIVAKNIKNIGSEVTLNSSYGIRLDNLRTISEKVNIMTQSSVYLDNLTSIHKGVSIVAGSEIVANKLVSVAEEVCLSAGLSLYLRSLISIPDTSSIICMNNIRLHENSYLESAVIDYPYMTLDKRFIRADGVLGELVGVYENYYKVRSVGNDCIVYLITDNMGKWSHGNTLKKAKESLKCLVSKLNERGLLKLTIQNTTDVTEGGDVCGCETFKNIFLQNNLDN